jgi:hypothetical protein
MDLDLSGSDVSSFEAVRLFRSQAAIQLEHDEILEHGRAFEVRGFFIGRHNSFAPILA